MRLQRLVRVYSCQNATLLEISCTGSYNIVFDSSGNWNGDGKFKMLFKSGGAIEFGQALIRAGKLGK